MKIEHDSVADALYITLLDEPCAYTKTIDDVRLIDYSVGHEPIGIELLCVSEGIDLTGIPHADEISVALAGRSFKIYA